MKKNFHVIGLMSGTSLDGLDIAYCTFIYQNRKWRFSVNAADTIRYNRNWIEKLQGAHLLTGHDLLLLHNEYGTFTGEKVNSFIKANKIKKVDFISSHGHTVFHQPSTKFTFQLGSGAAIAAACKKTVISDFRTLDVALNGQGAPLVPIGDKLLFGEYKYCINLGGFANISFDKKGKRIAYDICPANIVLNYLAQSSGKQFDENGRIAEKGKSNSALLSTLNRFAYYKNPPPKSLAREWVEKFFLPAVNNSNCSIADKLATIINHITFQVSKAIESGVGRNDILLTGGGAFNSYLVKQLQAALPNHKIVVPENNLVKYKEALIFAFLGVLRNLEKDNCLSSVTGAARNSTGGTIYVY